MDEDRDVNPDSIDALAEMLLAAERVLFVTGAGVSADSGLPTYRGVGGLYEGGGTHEGIPIEVALSGETLASRPEVCWKYISQIEQACRGALPNPAHHAIADLEALRSEIWVLTQNVDGFHRSAGSSNLVEIHGDLRKLRCTRCSWTDRVDDYVGLAAQLGTAAEPSAPRCPRCDAVIRPEVVLFGEMLPAPAVEVLQRELTAGFDLVVSVGTTSGFPYIAAPLVHARRSGGRTVEINPGQTEVSDVVDLNIKARAKPTFEALRRRLGR